MLQPGSSRANSTMTEDGSAKNSRCGVFVTIYTNRVKVNELLTNWLIVRVQPGEPLFLEQRVSGERVGVFRVFGVTPKWRRAKGLGDGTWLSMFSVRVQIDTINVYANSMRGECSLDPEESIEKW